METGAAPFVPPVNPDSYAPLVDPLIFFTGHLSPTVNEPHYQLLIQSVADAASRKVDGAGVDSWKAGWMVDTPGEWVEKKGNGHERIKSAVRAFGSELAPAIPATSVRTVTHAWPSPAVNVLVVVGSERLSVEMNKLMSTNKTVTVIRVPKSDGVSFGIPGRSCARFSADLRECCRRRISTFRPCHGCRRCRPAPTSTAARP